MNEKVEVQAPAPKLRVRRLEDWMKDYPVDQQRGTIMDQQTARAFVTYGRRKGWKMVQRNTQDDRICVWRVA